MLRKWIRRKDAHPSFWKRITNLPVESHVQAVHKLGWYVLRWKIETFFRTLKTGCRIEDICPATADRLAYSGLACVMVDHHRSRPEGRVTSSRVYPRRASMS